MNCRSRHSSSAATTIRTKPIASVFNNGSTSCGKTRTPNWLNCTSNTGHHPILRTHEKTPVYGERLATACTICITSAKSSRERDYSRCPLTPPYVRFRIRRFMGDAEGAAGYPAARSSPRRRRSVSGRPHSCVRHPSSTTDLVRFGPSARHDLPSIAVDAALWFGLDGALLAARAGSAAFVSAIRPDSPVRSWSACTGSSRSTLEAPDSVSRWYESDFFPVLGVAAPSPVPLAAAGFAPRYAVEPAAGAAGPRPKTFAAAAWGRDLLP